MKERQENASAKDKVNGAAPAGAQELLRERIAIRAHELFLGRGGEHGHAEEDWLEAVREIRAETATKLNRGR